MDDSKSPFLSKGVWGGIVAVVAGIIGAATGHFMSSGDQATLVSDLVWLANVIADLGPIVGGLLAIYGRVFATKKIAVGKQ